LILTEAIATFFSQKTFIMLNFPIYLDHHATTPVDPRVLDAMLPYFQGKFGNAASRNHIFGWEAEEAVAIARRQLAECIGADSKEIIFTSGATESNNLALKGVAESYSGKGSHIITNAAEHHAVLDTCKHLEENGFQVSYLPVRPDGTVDPDDVKKAITERTILISVMMANNEVGSINDLQTIGGLAHERGVLFHSDIAQAVGKIWIDVNALNIDLASVSGHKCYGPKGVGALFVRRKSPRVKVTAQMDGGGHENNIRSGTLNVPAIAGLGRAVEICRLEFERYFWHYVKLRNILYDRLIGELSGTQLNGADIDSEKDLRRFHSASDASQHIKRLPNNLNIGFDGTDGEGVMMAMKEIAVSSGSACTTASPEPSHVLQAMGLSREAARASLRFGIGRFNSQEEVDYSAKRLITVVQTLRGEKLVQA
jgi:cysteine desulfurase